jgi:hypothetical protein
LPAASITSIYSQGEEKKKEKKQKRNLMFHMVLVSNMNIATKYVTDTRKHIIRNNRITHRILPNFQIA